MSRGLWRIILYVLIILAPLTMVTYLNPVTLHQNGIIYETGKNLGLTAFMILMLQILLSGRFKWIERPYGMDILIRFHKHMAIFAVCLLVLHPVLLAGGGLGWKFLIKVDLPWYIMIGKLALLLLLVNVTLSLFQNRLRIKFEKWRSYHDILGPAISLLAFFHSWFAGQDLQNPPLKYLWPVILSISIGLFFYHRIIRPLDLACKPYRVIKVKQETEDVWTISLAPPPGIKKVFNYVPGQFHFITFHRNRNLPEEEHHWTISSSPTEKGIISSTIKLRGDFTSTIGETRIGDTATVHGPFGRFSYANYAHEQDLVFIAGGIGVTPLRSMLRHMHDTESKKPVLFIYANSDENNIVFRQELQAISSASYPHLNLVHILENPPRNWSGETGLLDKAKLERLCTNKLNKAAFYLCGPPGLIETVLLNLKDLGVPDKRIHLEIFSFID
jgi:predicted ferric reductase